LGRILNKAVNLFRSKEAFLVQLDDISGLAQFRCVVRRKSQKITVYKDGVEATQRFRKYAPAPLPTSKNRTMVWFWVDYRDAKEVRIKVGKRFRSFVVRNFKLGNKVSGNDLFAGFRYNLKRQNFLWRKRHRAKVEAEIKAFKASTGMDKCWLFVDRDDKADDNAEHFYRYVQGKVSGQNLFFVLRRDCADFERLQDEGFNLVEFGSDLHRNLLAIAEIVFCSQLTPSVIRPFNNIDNGWWGKLSHFRTFFLQHGVIMSNYSKWLNKMVVYQFVTSTRDEYVSIGGRHSSYKLSSKDVVLSGLPRWDNLWNLPKSQKSILIMPTWRRYFKADGTYKLKGMTEPRNFRESEFLEQWHNFLCSDVLKNIAEKQNLNIIFAPHPNLVPFLADFELPEYVHVYNHFQDGSIQEQLAQASVFVTDYSSVCFDAAYIGKPMVYFQFDRATIYKTHLPIGYFDYATDGFGPVCVTQEKALWQLWLGATAGVSEIHQRRVRRTFNIRDNNNCERVLERAMAMLAPESLASVVIQEPAAQEDELLDAAGLVQAAG
jgi:CDP-Glycerol:Poly(glycerophosphate) glycerophosphotransferase